MIPSLTSSDWYWLADDGRLFSSSRFATVAKGDPDYAAWCEAHRFGLPGHVDDAGAPVTMPLAATAWPRDAAGAQTDAALDDVLAFYGLSMTGPVRTARGRDLVHVLDKATKVCARDLAIVAALDPARENMASIARIAAVDGRKVSDWFDAALSATG